MRFKVIFEAIYLNGEIILDSQDGSHLICESLRGEHRFKSCSKIQAVGRETRDHNPRTNMSMVVRSKEHVRKKTRTCGVTCCEEGSVSMLDDLQGNGAFCPMSKELNLASNMSEFGSLFTSRS